MARLRALGVVTLALAAVPAAGAASTSSTHETVKPKRATTTKPTPALAAWHPKYTQAPADEYFGRLKMSILGVRNKVKDLGLDADAHPQHDAADLNDALWVEDAMRDWARKYPFDHWLPRYAFSLETMYERMPGPLAHQRAIRQLDYITAYFPQTLYGRIGRAKLAMGVPTPSPADPPPPMTDLQRLALLDGKVQPTMPPAPAVGPTPPPATRANVPVPNGTMTPIPRSSHGTP